jgi:hypothetical protein
VNELEETTMKIKFSCCFCGHKLKAATALAGRRGKCPRCAKIIRVPCLRPPAVLPTAIPLGVAPNGPVPVATAVPVKAEESSTPVPVTLRLRGFRKDNAFWLRIGGGVAGLLVLLAVLTLLTMG